MSNSQNIGNIISQIRVETYKIRATSKDKPSISSAIKIEELTSTIDKMLGLAAKHGLIIELSSLLDEHPEGWEGPCECKSCIEYASS